MSLNSFDFELPEELIAAAPAEPRDSSRLMVVDRISGGWRHMRFRDIAKSFNAGDCLVLNQTLVISARLLGKKSTGGKVDLLLVRELGPGLWTALSSGLRPGMSLEFAGGNRAVVEGATADGEFVCRFGRGDIRAYLEEHGRAPLPPYILKRRVAAGSANEKIDDARRYQTVYAAEPGSIAAPTAGLHFTPELIERLQTAGVRVARLTLHVGLGTFRPIKTSDIARHAMLPEWYRMDEDEARLVRRTMAEGGRVVAVGTTCTRTLETLAGRPEGFGPGEGWSDLFIRPGHRFLAVSGLVTNFHWPRSTPLILAGAFLGREKLLAAYKEAVREGYRFYSYGDAMLII